MKHNNISPAPKSPQALDDKILSYAREHGPKKQSYKSWYGYAATACALTLAVVMLPQLLQQAELVPTSPIAKMPPAAALPSSQPVMAQDMQELERDAGKDEFARQMSRVMLEDKMSMRKSKNQARQQAQQVIKKSRMVKRIKSEKMQLREVSVAAARVDPLASLSWLESLGPELRQLQQAAKENPAKANSDYQSLREKCDCELPENMSQAIDLLNEHKAQPIK